MGLAGDKKEAIAYLIPDELARLDSSGYRYRILIPDMNTHYSGYWDAPVPPGYYTYEQIIAIADSLAASFPSICKKVIWGTSLGGRELAALKISDNADIDEPEAEILFDGGIHGDEVGGSENLIRYARELCLAYGTDTAITDLVNTREIWLYLMVNPDGRVNMSRYNDAFVDCNRDFGYMWNAEGNSTGPFSQPESKALRDCMLDNQFVVYTNYHSGTEVIAYPWSYRSNPTPDNSHIQQLASVYSSTSGYPGGLLYGQGYNIMYPINGSTKDFQYGSLGNVGWSIEISNDKQPPQSMIMTYYNYNKPAMTEMIKRCGWGLEGKVTDSMTGDPVRATVWIDNYYPVNTDPVVGDYHKYVTQASYPVRVSASGYKTKVLSNVIVPSQGSVVRDFSLARDTGWYGFRVSSCQVPTLNTADAGYTPGCLGAPDDIAYSIGKNGWVVIDLGDTLRNLPGNDLTIIEAGTTPEGFTCYAGLSQDGTWTSLGNGMGTTGFDLGSLAKARYIKIVDDGDGPSMGEGIGYDLDAIRMLHEPLISDFIAGNIHPCTGDSVVFTDLSRGNPSSWSWTFPGGIPSFSALQNPSGIVYNAPGTYSVSLTVTDGTFLSAKTRTAYITVDICNAIPQINPSTAFTVFPNPGEGIYTVILNNANAGWISIYDLSGGKVAEQMGSPGCNVIDISGLPGGAYLFRSGSGSKVVIKK